MKWVTREKPHIDRIACAWAIKRFVDLEAKFIFIKRGRKVPQNVIPYDLPNVELGHHNEKCSFESLIERYKLKQHAATEIARIVHDIDLGVYKEKESIGIETIIKGLVLSSESDIEIYERSFPIFDGLYKKFSEEK
jgi:hypothetical protein